MSHIVPLPGPIDADPTREVARLARSGNYQEELRGEANPARVLAQKQLRAAVEPVEAIGAHDELVIQWVLSAWSVNTLATLASLMRRAFEAGVVHGKAESDEVYVAALDAIRDATSRAFMGIDDETTDRQSLLEDFIAAIVRVFDAGVPR